MNTNNNLIYSITIAALMVSTVACGGPDVSETQLTVTQKLDRARESSRDGAKKASCSKSSIEKQISELFPSGVPEEEELLKLRKDLTDFRKLLVDIREEIRVPGSVNDFDLKVPDAWTEDHINDIIASTDELINNLDELLDFIWSIAVVDGLSWNTLIDNITWEYSQSDLGNPGYTAADFFNDLFAFIDPNGPTRIARIANWMEEKKCKCDKDNDGFIGRPNGRDKNKNGQCDEDEDCDGNGKPGYCADCGWGSITTPELSYEDLLFEFDVTGFPGFIGEMNFAVDVMKNQLAGGAYGSCISP